MFLYLIIFIIPIFVYLSGSAINRNKTFLTCYMGALALFVGLSDMFGGYDRYIYGAIFDSIADGVTNGMDYRSVSALKFYELGYSALSYTIALITENRYIYIFIISTLIYYCIYKAFEKNMSNYPLSMILFLGMVFFFTFTYLRQVLAFSVAWLGVTYLIENKRWRFFMIALLVALLHKSGIVFAALYFIPLKKLKPNVVIIILGICAILGFSGMTGALYDAFANVSNAENMNSYSTSSSIRGAYFLEVIFFVWIILSNYNKIEPTRRNLVFLNMTWCFCGLLLLFIRSSDGGRVAWFFTLGIIYIVTLICTTERVYIRVKNSVGSLMIVVMLALYVRVYVSWQNYNNLYPYKTFLTNGYRVPDYSWINYEYDHRYDQNKFYRPAFRFFK